MPAYRVLVLGGYGFFGSRLVERLGRQPGLEVLVAGRSLAQAQAWVQRLQAGAVSSLRALALDINAPGLEAQLRNLAPAVVIHTCGPFQSQSYRVAEACITARAHYIDLADGRDFVCGIRRLDAAARAAGVAVLSGASSVPALSSAAADHLSAGFEQLHSIDIGISPGNKTERGLSTVQAILSYCGKPLPAAAGRPRHGWVGRWTHRYPAPVGLRWLSPCDVPDLTLLPQRYPGQPEVRFGAGLELKLLHAGMNLIAQLARWGWVHDWSRHARWLKRASDALRHVGTDTGAMHVCVTGLQASGRTASRTWTLCATRGDGPYVPTLAAAAMVRRLRAGDASLIGAQPCVGLLSLAEFARECEGLNIEMGETPGG
jgi:hypothetical protein